MEFDERECLKETLVASQADEERADSVDARNKGEKSQTVEAIEKIEEIDPPRESGESNETLPSDASDTTSSTTIAGQRTSIRARALSIIVSVFLLGGLSQLISWYAKLPRLPDRENVPLISSMAALAGWVGEPDAAYCSVAFPGSFRYRTLPEADTKRDMKVTILERFIRESSPGTRPLSCLMLAFEMSKMGNTAGAIEKIDDALKVHPGSSVLHIMKGYLLAYNGDFEAALKEIDKTDKSSSYAPSIVLSKATILRTTGQPQKALQMLETAKFPSYLEDDAENEKAQIYLTSGDPKRAISMCQASLQRFGDVYDQLQTRQTLALAYLMDNDAENAFAQARSVAFLEEKQNDQKRGYKPLSELLLSRIYCKINKFDEARRHADRACKGSPTIQSQEQRAFVLNQLKDYEQALSAANDALGYGNLFTHFSLITMTELHLDKAIALAGLKRYQESLEEISIVLKRNPHCRRACLKGREVALAIKDRKAAAQFDAQAAAIPPSSDHSLR